MNRRRTSLTISQAAAIFAAALLYLVLLLWWMLPMLRAQPGLHPATHWYLIGFVLFPPMIAYAVWQAHREGANSFAERLTSLNIRPMSQRDWRYAAAGVFSVLGGTGVLLAAWSNLARLDLLPPVETEPWCIDMSPLEGRDRLLLLLWAPMFVLNIVGEELLWRGYVQSRLTVRWGWLVVSLLWLAFHIPFGIPVMVLSLPLMLILPFIFDRTKNTTVAILIHGMYNGPAFLAAAFGLLPG
ncbi:CPBP family intramembrane glutamic endopeptidase [Rhodopirellula sp. P2]|uniref:CPBP family intramembrane glutamic endopeptidase n=1 Tax=Rhodopirellula sp. P2 TaxID=2127060 RepID=UPI002367C4FA|nr:CPBP family intramembrane glutamic endopeptidase [Rhodopirellula sp. P2]WDQ15520.1 CPBP family intramembrane metalloprotease [Rhodopirellula sp. P2]